MSLVFAKIFNYKRAGDYTNPGIPGAILPIVYGDLTSGGDRGAVPAVLIDSTARVYAAAGHAIGSVTDVYVGNQRRIVTTDYTVNVSDNYEGRGTIATITFTAAHGIPTDVVTWRGTGWQLNGSTNTNCITQLEDLLTTWGGWTSSDFAKAELEEARAAVSDLGYQTAWVVHDEQYIGAWINEFLFNVLGTYYITGDQKLVILIDQKLGDTIDEAGLSTSDVVAHLHASRDIVDGNDGVVWTGDILHLCNALDIYYLWNWAGGDQGGTRQQLGFASSRIITETDAVSKNSPMGEVRKSISLRGHRVTGGLTTWAGIFFERFAMRNRVEGGMVEFQVHGPKLLAANRGQLITLSWDYGPRRERGNLYRNEVLKILRLTHDPLHQTTGVLAQDLGFYVSQDTYYDALAFFDADEFFGGSRELGVLP